MDGSEQRKSKDDCQGEGWDEETRRLAFSPVREFASIGRRNLAIRRLIRDMNAGLSGPAKREA